MLPMYASARRGVALVRLQEPLFPTGTGTPAQDYNTRRLSRALLRGTLRNTRRLPKDAQQDREARIVKIDYHSFLVRRESEPR